MELFTAVVCGVLGLVIGSFLNVVIYRVPQHLSIVRPPSHCPVCDHPIRARDNIPVVSWVILRARCRDCGTPISARYPAVELLTGALFVFAALRFSGSLSILPYCIGFGGLVALAFIDIDTRLLPKRVVWPVTGMVLAAFVATAAVESRWDDLQRALLGSAASALAIGLVWFVYPKGMGFGDVRLEVPAGLLTGWVSRGTVAAGIALAFALGGVLSALLLVTGIRGRKDAIPFGPWLALGCVIAVLWSATGRWMEQNYVTPVVDLFKTLF